MRKLLLEQLLDRAMASIADYIQRPSGTLVVFNPLNWQRSNLVEVDIDKGIELVDLASERNRCRSRNSTPARASATCAFWLETFPPSAISATRFGPPRRALPASLALPQAPPRARTPPRSKALTIASRSTPSRAPCAAFSTKN